MYVQVDVHNVTCNICAYQCIEDTLFHLWTSRPYFSTSQSKSWMFPPVAASWAKWYPFYMLQWSCSSGDGGNTHWLTDTIYTYTIQICWVAAILLKEKLDQGEVTLLSSQSDWTRLLCLDHRDTDATTTLTTKLHLSEAHKCVCTLMYCFSHVHAGILVITEECLWGYALAC